VERDDELSIRPRVLVLLAILAAVAAIFAFEAIRAGQAPSEGSSTPTTNPSEGEAPTGDVGFGISGSVTGLVPGATREIAVTFTNSNAVPIYVTDLKVSISPESDPAGCSSAANMILRQATGITEQDPIFVPAGEQVTVRTYPRAPELTFRNLDVNQDECKDVRFALTYSGSAHT
jgi:hypothetical protein